MSDATSYQSCKTITYISIWRLNYKIDESAWKEHLHRHAIAYYTANLNILVMKIYA